MLNIIFPVVSLVTDFLLSVILLLFWAFGVNEWEPLPAMGELGSVYPVLGIVLIMTSILSANWVFMFITRYKQCFEENVERSVPEYYYHLTIVLFLVFVIHGAFTLITSLGWIGAASHPVVMFLVIHLIFKILYFGGFSFCLFCWVIEDIIMSFIQPESKSIFVFLFLRISLSIISIICFAIFFAATTGINFGLDTDSMFASIDYFFVALRVLFFAILVIENIWISSRKGYGVIKNEITRVKKYTSDGRRRRRKKKKKKRSENLLRTNDQTRFISTSGEEELPLKGKDFDGVYSDVDMEVQSCDYCGTGPFRTEIDLLCHIKNSHPFHMKELREDQIEKLMRSLDE